jgi:YVTN family beta-propeller protein
MRVFGVIFLCAAYLISATTLSFAETTAYIPNSGADTVTQVLTTGETFESVTLQDSPYGAAVTPDGGYVFITRSGTDIVTRIPTNNFDNADAQIDITVGNDPRGVAAEPESEFVYVANFDDDTVSKIAIRGTSVDETISVGNGPLGVAAAYDQIEETPVVYVTNNPAGSLTVIGEDDQTTPVDNLCDEPAGVAVTPNGATVYVACTGDNTVKVIRTSTNTPTATIGVGNQPWGVAVGSDGQYVFVTNSGGDSVTVITTSDNEVADTITVGDNPMGVAAPLNGDFAYVVNQIDDSIHVIDVSSDTISTTEIGVNELDGAVSIGAFIGGSPPSAPSGLEAETVEDTEIELTWNDNSSDELGFKIERRKDEEDAFVQVAKVDDDTESYNDSELEGGTTYHYRIRAYNEAADSDPSNSAEATTADGNFSWCFVGTISAYDSSYE